MTPSRLRLLGDLGGTNARLSLMREDAIGPLQAFKAADFGDVEDLLRQYLLENRLDAAELDLLLACAGPVEDQVCEMTNLDWIVDGPHLKALFDFRRVRIYNDFEATGRAVSELQPADLLALGGETARPERPALVLGPGTGLGIACFLPDRAAPRVLASEGGHAAMAAGDLREERVLERLRAELGFVSIETLLSGSGLLLLYRTLALLEEQPARLQSAPEITEAALAASDPFCVGVMQTFCAMLGGVAGDLALTFGAQGGVYIAGGIAPRLGHFLRDSQFRARFEAKGRFAEYLRPIPAHLIMRGDAAMLGLAAFSRAGS